MAFVDRIVECNAHDPHGHVPWRVDGAVVGHVRVDRVADLLASQAGFRGCAERGLELGGASVDERSRVLADGLARLVRAGRAPEPLGETYPVSERVLGPPRCLVDRAHVAWLGVAAAGVHVNGFVRTSSGGIDMWIAERSRAKRTFPGLLDNFVAGGQPHGIGLLANVVKECGEEAGVPAALAARAVPVGAVAYVFEDETGLKPDTMFCFDLELPDDFVPRCVDGEVERFERMPIAEVARLVRDSRRFKFNCNLVVLDFLVRHAVLEASAAERGAIVAGLWRRVSR